LRQRLFNAVGLAQAVHISERQVAAVGRILRRQAEGAGVVVRGLCVVLVMQLGFFAELIQHIRVVRPMRKFIEQQLRVAPAFLLHLGRGVAVVADHDRHACCGQ
jgi:hypothetical protein